MMETKHIAIVGDTHDEDFFQGVYRYLEDYEERTDIHADALVHVGDTGITRDGPMVKGDWAPPIPTHVCPGNHDDFALMRELRHTINVPNLFVMSDGWTVSNIFGLRFGAIWGNFSPKSWAEPGRVAKARMACTKKTAWSDDKRLSMHIHKMAVQALAKHGPLDVLITHDAPLGLNPSAGEEMPNVIKYLLGLTPDEKPTGCPGFLDIYEKCKPTWHFFGHHHRYACMRSEHPRVVSLNAFDQDPIQSVVIIRAEK